MWYLRNKSTLLEGQVSERHEQGATVCVLEEIIALHSICPPIASELSFCCKLQKTKLATRLIKPPLKVGIRLFLCLCDY